MELLTGPQRLRQHEGVTIPLDFTPSNYLQGLGCVGDDGWLEITGVPPGMWYVAETGDITGTPNTVGFFTITIDVIGTTEDCSQLHNYYQGTIEVEVVLWNYVPAPCGTNSSLITSLWLIRTYEYDRVLGSYQGVFPPGYSWFDELLGPNAIQIPVKEGKVEENPKDEPAGPLYEIKIEATLTKDRPVLERFRREIAGKDWIAYLVDGNRIERVYGSSSFALRAMVKLSKGKSNQATLSIQGSIPNGSVIVNAFG